jgi:hypothetical protein
LDRVLLKVKIGNGVGECRKQCGGLLFFWSLCVFGYISFVVEEYVIVRDCRGLGLCKNGIVGCSVGEECEGGRGSLVVG